MLKHSETINNFLTDFFFFCFVFSMKDQWKQQVKTQLYCCAILKLLEIMPVNNWWKCPKRKLKNGTTLFFEGRDFKLILKDEMGFIWKHFISFFSTKNWREKLSCWGSLWPQLFIFRLLTWMNYCKRLPNVHSLKTKKQEL